MSNAYIIQIADREGFDDFLTRLTCLHVNYKVERIAEDIYKRANSIKKCCKREVDGLINELCFEESYYFPAELFSNITNNNTSSINIKSDKVHNPAMNENLKVSNGLITTNIEAFVVFHAWR